MSALASPQLSPEADTARLLYERYSSRVLGYCVNRLGTREEAEDAVQTTFLNAFRGLRRGVVPQAEGAWLFKIADNVCRDHRRSAWNRRRRETTSDAQVLERTAATVPTDRDDRVAGLAAALAELPENQRKALLLREWQGLSYRDIAAELALTQSAVETLLFRARRSVARFVERQGQRIRSVGADLLSVASALKTALGGGGAVKLAVTVAALAGTSALAGPPLAREVDRSIGKDTASVRVERSGDSVESPVVARGHDAPAAGTNRSAPAARGTRADRSVSAPRRSAPPAAKEETGPATPTPTAERPAPAAGGADSPGRDQPTDPSASAASTPTPGVAAPPLPDQPVPALPDLPVPEPAIPQLPPASVPDLPSATVPDLPGVPGVTGPNLP